MKILKLLRLNRINHGIFVKLNMLCIRILDFIESNVTYGYPSYKVVRKLVYMRGFVKIKGNKILISNNFIIEKFLGKFDIICIDDLINAIHTVGPYFKEV